MLDFWSAIMKKQLQPSILVVEDEDGMASVLNYTLKKEGYSVHVTNNGPEAIDLAREIHPDLILLDWMLPNMTGVEVCRILRQKTETQNIPIIMISAKGDEVDKITGLDRGADDYIVKPFAPAELIARIKAVLRRMRPAFSGKILEFFDIKMDLKNHSVIRNNKELSLSPIEFKILQILIENPGRVLSRESLMDKIWGNEVYVGSRTVDVHITRLRKMLLDTSLDNIDIIKTIRLAGYTLRRTAD